LTFGHEISLHGYKHAKNEFGSFYPIPLPFIPYPSFKVQRQRILLAAEHFKRLTGFFPKGFRAPFYLYNKETFKVLSSLKFRYDSSKTLFKPTHGISLRIRWTRKCKPHKIYDLIEIPVTGDYTYNLKKSNLHHFIRRAVSDYEWIESKKGAFVMNIHLHRLSSSLLSKFLVTFVKKIRRTTDFVRLVDVDL